MEQTDRTTQAEITIDEHLNAQKTGFKLQTAGLIAILAIVLLAALGFFGDGVLSSRTIQTNQLSVAYQGFYRYDARTSVDLLINESDDSMLTVSIPAKYLAEFRLESVVPRPNETKSRNGMVHFVFSATSGSRVVFYISPEKEAIGLSESLWHVNGKPVRIKQFIFP